MSRRAALAAVTALLWPVATTPIPVVSYVGKGWVVPSTGRWAVPGAVEPVADYAKTAFGGRVVNQRTRVMLNAAQLLAGMKLTITQGSYSKGVSASSGTHDGGGAVDVGVLGLSPWQITSVLKALRLAGFAAWHRTPAQGFAPHIHAVAIGDKELSPAAAGQVEQYFAGTDGLRYHRPDTSTVGHPWPRWVERHRNWRANR